MTNGKCCIICKVFGLLVVIGAINWGLVGAFQINLVSQLLGGIPKAERIVYILVGIAGVAKLLSCFIKCPACCGDKGSCGTK
jgi:uncharacterized protein